MADEEDVVGTNVTPSSVAGTSGVGYNQLSDPTIREMVKNSFLTQGNSGVFRPTDYAPLQEQELSLAKERLSNLATAERTVALRDVEKNMQKRGLTFSGQTEARQVETSDEIRLRELAEYNKAQENVLARYSGYRENERGRQYEMASALIEAETSERLKEIDRDTSLSLADKEAARAAATNASQERIAAINVQGDIDVAGVYTKSSEKISADEIANSQTLAKWTINANEAMQIRALGSSEKVAFAGYDTEMQKAYLSAKTSLEIQTMVTKEGRYEFDKQLEQMASQFSLSEANKKDIVEKQLTAEFERTKMVTDADVKNVAAQIAWAREKGYMDDATARKLAFDQLTESARQFNVGSYNDMQKLQAQLQSAMDLKMIDSETAKTIAGNELAQRTKEFNFTSQRSILEFGENLQLAKDTFGLNKQQVQETLKLARDKFNEDCKNWKVTNEEDSKRFWATFAEGQKQFGLTHQLAVDAFKEQQLQFKTTTEEGSKQFWANYQIAKDSLNEQIKDNTEKNKLQSRLYDIQETAFKESMREFDLTRGDTVAQFSKNLQLAYDTLKTQSTDAALERELKQSTLNEQVRQFNVSSADEMTKYLTTLRSTMSQFNISQQEQHWYAAECLKLQAAQAEDSDIANWSNAMSGLLMSPIMESLSDEELQSKVNVLFRKMDEFLPVEGKNTFNDNKASGLDVEALVKDIKSAWEGA